MSETLPNVGRPPVSLLVPVQVEALVVNRNDRRAVRWSVSTRTVAGADRFLPLEPPPFATGNDRPRLGVTVHWLLPDALTVGRWHDAAPGTVGASRLRYPFAPDRWLVVRVGHRVDASGEPSTELPPRAWVVESNYVGSDGTNPTPAPGGGLEYLGRSVDVSDWPPPERPVDALDDRWVGVTAVGVVSIADLDGRETVADIDPAWAASVANVDDVFALHDPLDDLDPADAFELSYSVIGWYADPERSDPMVDQSRLGRELAASARDAAARGGLSVDEWRTVMATLGWSVGDDNDLRQAQLSATADVERASGLVPTRTVCHGSVLGVRWLGLDGAAQPFTSGEQSAFASSAIRSRAGWRNPVPSAAGEFGDIDAGPSLGDAAHLRRPGGADAAPGRRSSFPQVAIGTSVVDAQAALFEFLLGREAGGDDPSDLATLFLALEHDLLGEYERPGGVDELARRLHQESFLPQPGGGSWEIVLRRPGDGSGDTSTSGDPVAAPDGIDLVSAIDREDGSIGLQAKLAALNAERARRDLDEADLRAEQHELYALWWKRERLAGSSSPPASAPEHGELATRVRDRTDAVSDLQESLARLVASVAGRQAELEALLTSPAVVAALAAVVGEDGAASLELIDVPSARFFAPADPVVVISGARASPKHGGDGHFSADGTLLVRFAAPRSGAAGQTLRYRGGIPDPIGGAEITQAILGDLLSVDGLPDVTTDLLAEQLVIDRGWARRVAELADPPVDAPTLRAAQSDLWRPPGTDLPSVAAVTRDAGFVGVRPSPVAVEPWSPPWRPLHLAWRATWYPCDAVSGERFEHWVFNGDDLAWTGLSEFDHSQAQTIQGRCLLSTTSARSLQDAVDAVYDRVANAAVDPRQTPVEIADRQNDLADLRRRLDQVKQRLGTADLVAQALTGFHDHLVQRDPAQCYRPTDADVAGAVGAAALPAPMPYRNGPNARSFFPIRAGHARIRKLWIVDAFGQVMDVIDEQGQTDESFAPLRGRGVATVGLTQRSDTQMLQFPPRFIQPSRLLFRFDDAGGGSPVAGWILPNHLDNSVMVYDAAGDLLGAVLLWHGSGGGDGVRWESAPGRVAGTVHDAIEVTRLRDLVEWMTSRTYGAFVEFLQAIDRTLWTTDPAGQRGDNLSVLVGRPIAVVGATLAVELDGPLLTDQRWEHSLTSHRDIARTGSVTQLRVPVRLGLPESPEDGTIGYVRRDQPGFTSVLAAPDRWLTAPVRIAGERAPDATEVTVLIDPRGTITATSGIQPAKSLRLPRRFVDAALATMDASFRVGPILTGRTMRMPLPADIAGGWSWIEHSGVALSGRSRPSQWSEPVEVEAAALTGHLADAPTRLRDGWLLLSDVIGAAPQEGDV